MYGDAFVIKKQKNSDNKNFYLIFEMTSIMKKLILICEKQRHKSATLMRRLISTFGFRCIDSIIYLASKSGISGVKPSPVAVHLGLCLTWSEP